MNAESPVGGTARTPAASDGGRRIDAMRAYRASLRNDAVLVRKAETYVEVQASSPLGPTDALATVLEADRLMLIGAPGSGKTTTLKVALLRRAGHDDESSDSADLPVYVDLNDARPGEGVEDLIVRVLAAASAGGRSGNLAPSVLYIDNLDRATDVYLLEGLELLLRAGGRAGPSVVMACREADWPAYRSWFEDVPGAVLQPLTPQKVFETLSNSLPEPVASAATSWLARDRVLAGAVRSPLGLSAFVGAVRDRAPEAWRRAAVLDALLEAGLAHVPSGERSSYRSALSDVALDSLGQGRLVEVDTVAMGLGVTRDEMIRTGVVVARGPKLEFVEPLLAQHCAAKRLADRAAADPQHLAERLGDLHDPRRADTMVHVFHLAPDPVAFSLALLPLPGGPELVSRCLTEPDAVDPAGPNGVGGTVSAICDASPDIGASAMYRLGEALHRSGHDDAAEVALRAALDRSGSGDDLSTVFLRPDVDGATPVDQWVREFLAKRNRGLAMRGMRDMDASATSLAEADEALDRINADLAFERGMTSSEAGDLAAACVAFEVAVDAEPESARYLYHYGRTLLALGRVEDAVKHLMRARELAPGRAEIEATLGNAYREQGLLDEALRSLHAAGRLAPSDPRVAQATGEVHAELGDLEAAAAAMQLAVAAQPKAADWHDALSQVLLELGRVAAAVGGFRAACALSPDEPRRLRHLGRAHLMAGDATEAVDAFRRAYVLDPDGVATLAELGRALGAAGLTAEAIDVLRRAIASDGDWPEDHLHLSRALRAHGDLDEALRHAIKATELAPASALAYSELGQVRDARGDVTEAAEAYGRALELAPDDLDRTQGEPVPVDDGSMAAGDRAGEKLLGDIRTHAPAAHDPTPMVPTHQERSPHVPTADLPAQQERSPHTSTPAHGAATPPHAAPTVTATAAGAEGWSTVADEYAKAREHDAEDVALAAAHGGALRQAGRLEEARKVLEAVWRADRECALVLVQLGLVYEELGRDKDALQAFSAAAESGSLEPRQLARYSGVARRLGENDTAIETAREAVAMQPGWADAYAVLGEAYAAAGLTEGALMAMRRAAEVAPREPAYRVSQARLAQQLGQRAEAVDALETGVTHSPDSRDLFLALGRAYEEQGRADEAQTAYDRAAALAPDEMDRRRVPGETAEITAAGAPVDAVRDLAATSPDDAAAQHELGLMLMRAGELQSALPPLQRATHLVPDEAAYHRSLGKCLAGLGQPGAGDALKASLALDPGSAETHAALAEVLASQGSLPSAQDALVAATRLAPSDASYWRALGALRLGRQDAAGAREALGEAVRLDPADPEARELLHRATGRAGTADESSVNTTKEGVVGTALSGRTATEGASIAARRDDKQTRADAEATIQSLERVLVHQPDDAEILVALSRASGAAGRVEDAVGYARRATEFAADSAPAWLALAVAQRSVGDRTAAVAAAERALGIDATNTHAAVLKAQLAEDLGDMATALETYAFVAAQPDADASIVVKYGELAATHGWHVPLLLPDPAPPIDPTLARSAATSLQGVLESATDMTKARAAAALAVVHGRSGRAADAVAVAEQAVAAHENTDTLTTLAWAQLLNGAPTEALTALAACRAIGSDQPRVHWLTARAHRDRHEPELALEALRAALQLEPGQAGVLADLAATHLVLDQVDDAIEIYHQAMALDDGVRIVCGAARAARIAGQPHEALSMLARAADRTPHDAELHHETALAHTSLGNEASALQSLEQACHLRPNHAAWWAELGQAHFVAEQVDDARRCMERAIELDPDQTEFMVAAAEMAIAAGDHDAARTAAETLLAATDTKVAAHALFGKVALAAGDMTSAQSSFEKAVGLEPSSAEMHHLLGVAAKSAGDRRTAMDHLETATRLSPSSVDTYVALGEVYAAEGLWDDAVQALQQAVVIDPDSSEAHLRLGAVCGEAGLTDKSLASLQRAIELDPDDYRPRYAMAKAYVKASDPRQAVAAFEDAITKSAAEPEVLFGAGLAYKGLRDYGRAAELFKQVTQVSPKNAAAYTQLAAVSALHFLDRVTAERKRD